MSLVNGKDRKTKTKLVKDRTEKESPSTWRFRLRQDLVEDAFSILCDFLVFAIKKRSHFFLYFFQNKWVFCLEYIISA